MLPEIPEPALEKQLHGSPVDIVDGAHELFVDSCHEGYRAPGDAGNHIRRTHAYAFEADKKVFTK